MSNEMNGEVTTSTAFQLHLLMQWLWILASFVSACYASVWDVLMDWRLFVNKTSGAQQVAGVFRRRLLFKQQVS